MVLSSVYALPMGHLFCLQHGLIFILLNGLHDFVHVDVNDSYCPLLSIWISLSLLLSFYSLVVACSLNIIHSHSLTHLLVRSFVKDILARSHNGRWCTRWTTVDINLYLVRPILMTINANNDSWNKAEKSKKYRIMRRRFRPSPLADK